MEIKKFISSKMINTMPTTSAALFQLGGWLSADSIRIHSILLQRSVSAYPQSSRRTQRIDQRVGSKYLT